MTRLAYLTVWTTALTGVLWAGGCASTGGSSWDWHDNSNGGGPNWSGRSFDPLALREIGLASRWFHTIDTTGASSVTELELLGDLLIAVEGPDNLVTALDVETGDLAWKNQVGLPLEDLFKPLRRGDQVYVNSAIRFFTLDADGGELRGVANLESPVTAGAVLHDDYAIFGAANGQLFAHDVETGYAKWRYQFAGQIVAAPVLSGDDVFAADAVGTYALLESSTGDLVWRNKVFGKVNTSATIHRGDVLVPSQDRSLYALNRATGSDSWVYRATQPLTKSPLSVGRNVYLPVPEGGLIALNSDGTEKWQIDMDATPVLAGDRGLYTVTDGALVLLDPETGDVRSGVKITGLNRAVPGPDGSLIVLTEAGRVVRLDAID